MAYARRGMEAIRTALRETDPDDAPELARTGLSLPEARVAAGCAYADGEMPTLVCHYGPSASQPVAQAVFWYAQGIWQAQLYPQAPLELAGDRAEVLAGYGCRLGCSSGVVRARQAPGAREMLVVIDMGFSSGRRAEEAQLLRFDEGRWQLVWAPPGGDWNYGDAAVEFANRGLAQFRVRSSSRMRQDLYSGYLSEPDGGEHRRFVERWERKNSAYVMADRSEEPTPYSTLVRLIHYVSVGGDEKAAALLARDLPLDEVRQALTQRPRRQGWTVTRWGGEGFLLDTKNSGKPDLGVRFAKQDDGWVLAELWHTPH
jgi:hypothetical protein